MAVITINQLIGILCVVVSVLATVGYLSTKAMMAKYLKSIENSEEKHIAADKKFIQIENDLGNALRYVKNNESDINELRNRLESYTNSIKTLTETITDFSEVMSKVENNSQERHVEMKKLVSDNNDVMLKLLNFLNK